MFKNEWVIVAPQLLYANNLSAMNSRYYSIVAIITLNVEGIEKLRSN